MSIEGGGTVTRGKSVIGMENSGLRGQGGAKSAGKADAHDGGGFLALLMSVGAEIDSGRDGSDGADQSALVAPQSSLPDPLQAALLPLPNAPAAMATQPVAMADLPVVMAQNLENDLAMLLAQAGMGGSGASAQKGGVAPQFLLPDPPQAAVLPLSNPPVAMPNSPVAMADPPVAMPNSPVAKADLPVAMAQNLENDLAMLLAQAGMGGSGASAQKGGVAPQFLLPDPPQAAILPLSNPPVVIAENQQQDLTTRLAPTDIGGPGETDQIAGFVPPISVQNLPQIASLPLSNPPVVIAPNVRHEQVAGIDKPEKAIDLTGYSVSALPEGAGEIVAPFQGQTEQLVPVRPSKSSRAEFLSRTGASPADSRLPSLAYPLDVPVRERLMSGVQGGGGMGDIFVRQAEPATTKSSEKAWAPGMAGLWGQHASPVGGSADAHLATGDPSMSSLESMVADTVGYWVTQGVQTAELTLDGLGGEPVEVSISLKGEDAHIDFRTDQPEIRRVLEGAAAHLKDILAGEGLVLSGVSVGSSGQDGAATQDQRNRQSARQASVVISAVAPTEVGLRVVQSTAGAVDIFV